MKTETTNQPQTLQGFTPGEWEIVTDMGKNIFPDEIFIAVKNKHGIYETPICGVHFGQYNKRGKDNAALIISAPTLLKENNQLKEELGKQKIHLEGMYANNKEGWSKVEKYEKEKDLLKEQVRLLRQELKQFIHSVEHEGEVHGRIAGSIESATEALNQTK